MHKILKLAEKYSLFLFLIIFLSVFYSCSKSSQKKSFISSLDEVDALIKQGFYEDAVFNLEKLEKNAYNSWSQLGIVKRYLKLSEIKNAEEFLLKSLKNNPKNMEICAVLTDLYLNQKNYDSAIQYGKNLSDSKYGSLYSEAIFSKAIEDKKKLDYFYSEDLFDLYFKAYETSMNQVWLQNCAVFYLLNGNYSKAQELSPEKAENLLFWILVNYDSAHYGDTIFYGNEFIKKNSITDKNYAEIVSLVSDSYFYLLDLNSSQKVREDFIKLQNSYKIDKENIFIPIIYTNSAVWQFEFNNRKEAFSEILTVLNNFPDYFNALSVYADFSYKSNLIKEESSEQKLLRDYGIATLEMEKFEKSLKIPFSDVIFRVKSAMEKNNSYQIQILNFDLLTAKNQAKTQTEKISELYNLLEKNQLGQNSYPDEILNYSVNFLLNNNKTEEAQNLFYNFIYEKYNFSVDEYFWKSVLLNIKNIDLSNLELLAFFAAFENRKNESLALYEYVVYEYFNSINDFVISSNISTNSVINLADIYYSTGKTENALKLYSKLTGKINDHLLKSLVFYRISKIYFDKNDFINAKINADYAISLNPRNVDAKYLVSLIENLKNNK